MSSGRGTIGNPTSSRGEGIAHPRGRFDVTAKPAGNGVGVIDAEVASRLSLCKTTKEAIDMGLSKSVAEMYFATQNPAHIAEPRFQTGESVRAVLNR